MLTFYLTIMLRLINLTVIFFVVLCCSFFLTASSRAAGSIGRDVCTPYKSLVVQITTQFSFGEENGFGFLVGERDNQFYIVTANHVVRSNLPDNPTQKVLLHFSWDPGSRGYKAELLSTMYKTLDLALLRIDKNRINGAERVRWEGRKWCRRWQQDEEAWFIGRARQWYIPPDRRAGILVRTEPDLRGFIQLDIDSVQPGTSGAPLFIRNGLIGMIITDSPSGAQAVHIDYIRRFVSVENPYPWNLVRHEDGLRNGRTIMNRPSSRYREVKKAEVVHSTSQGLRTPVQKEEKKASKRPVQQVSQPSVQDDVAPNPSTTMENARNTSVEPAEKIVEQPVFSPPEPGDLLQEPLTKMDFIRLPAGCFSMGAAKKEKGRYRNEAPPHPVCVDAFWMGKHEVTLTQWAKIIGKRPRRSQGSEKHPAVPVTWEEAQDFIRRLNEKTGRVFRLPTEAEWEYAARAGATTTRYWGDDISCDKAMYGNDANESGCIEYVQQQGGAIGAPAPVGSYPSNKFGLHDMLGNVREWCADWYGDEYYFSSPKDKPTGPSQSSADPPARVLRGGSWLYGSRIIRAAARQWLAPARRYYDTGFRLILVDQEGGSDGP
ncbi:MAG: hypothetical protein D3917_13705 [Candidatus Electrothrix sp. AX5]|nr:hypothetical protein [Candidatus Electrothrix sp. AX5]